MKKIVRIAFASFLIAAAIAPHVWPKARQPELKPHPAEPPQEKKPDITAPSQIMDIDAATGARAIFLTLHPQDDSEKLLQFLTAHPDLRLTIIFPPRYFEDEKRRGLSSRFNVLRSSGQIEIALILDNEPILPLLGDLSLAGDAVSKWGIHYQWPDDISAQIARTSARYQKRWGDLPAGFVPPHRALSKDVIDAVKKFRLNWVMAMPQSKSGIRFYGGTALIVPPAPTMAVEEDPELPDEWADAMAEWSLERPFTWIDASRLENADADVLFLEKLYKRWVKGGTAQMLVTAREFVEPLRNEFRLPEDATPFDYNYSAWVSLPQQKRAWTAIADARNVIETYQRSGRAQLPRLDAAIEEMCVAQSGKFLKDPTGDATTERTFIATLSNIYRLCETPVPPNLNTWFASRTWTKAAPKINSVEGPFFVEGPQSLTWNDPKEDENGAGKYLYPIGAYPKGLFDLRELTITWTDADVTLSVSVADGPGNKPISAMPMVDIYIDVNRLADAGSTAPLKRRGNTVLAREAAWEYAVTLSPNTAALYQVVPGGSPRVLGTKMSELQGKTFSVSFMRDSLRGDPKRWRFSVGLSATENSKRLEESFPLPILANPTEKNFGGATGLAPYVDLLADGDEQEMNLAAHASGATLTLPFVESQ